MELVMKKHRFEESTAKGANPDWCVSKVAWKGSSKPCGGHVMEAMHQRTTTDTAPFSRIATVEVYVQRGEGYLGGIHFATITWQQESHGDWFSAWFKPHNDTKFYRVMGFDTWNSDEVGRLVSRILGNEFTEADYGQFGVTNQYVKRS